MSAPSTTTLIVVPQVAMVGMVAAQARPTSEGVRIIVTTPSARGLERFNGVILDTVIVMPDCRSGAWDGVFRRESDLFFARARALHRGNGPWIEMDPNYRNIV